MYKRIDIKISFRCNNLCSFCAQGHKRDMYSDRTPQMVARELKKAYAEGVRGVVFTGGEPSLHPAILEFFDASSRTEAVFAARDRGRIG